VLTFPSHTPDHVLHRTVRRELGLGPPEPKPDHGLQAAQAAAQGVAEMAKVSAALTQQVNALAGKIEQAAKQTGASHEQIAHALQEMGTSHGSVSNQHMTHAQALTEAQKRVADAVSKHMGVGERHHDVMKELSATQLETAKAMSRFVTAVANIVKSLDGTKDSLQKIEGTLEDICKAMCAPKILVLDAKGNPVGVKLDN
jgi:predicted  nucleic acid-binding Zn-ribbon protein